MLLKWNSRLKSPIFIPFILNTKNWYIDTKLSVTMVWDMNLILDFFWVYISITSCRNDPVNVAEMKLALQIPHFHSFFLGA